MTQTWALATLATLALVVLSLYRSAAKCPRCGSLSFTTEPVLPKWRRCSQCHEVYEIRLH